MSARFAPSVHVEKTFDEGLDRESCPKCHSSWMGEPIPQDIRHLYSGTHFRREIGIENPWIYDGMCAIQCPDCNEYFPVSSHPVHARLFEEFMNGGKKQEGVE